MGSGMNTFDWSSQSLMVDATPAARRLSTSGVDVDLTNTNYGNRWTGYPLRCLAD